MRKFILIGIMIFSVAILSGCGTQKMKTVTCTLDRNDIENGYQMTATYEIYTDGEIVDKVKTVEKVFSDNDEVLSSFENYLNNVYEPMNDRYGGYDVDIKKDSDSLTSTVVIDYKKVDIEKLLTDQPSMSSMVNDENQILLASIKTSYSMNGAVCE